MTSSQRVLSIAALGLLAACGPGSSRDDVPPHVVIVSLDTVRADEIASYGGPAGATPTIDGLAAAATRYPEAVSSAPWTMPTHASMFTGLFPFEHGAHSFLPGEGHRGDNVFGLHARFETLAESLGRLGYRSAGVVANSIYLRPQLGLQAGFQTWDVKREPGASVTDRALRWVDENAKGDRPFFLFVNYMDAHRPYAVADPQVDAESELDALIERGMDRGEKAGERGARVAQLHQRAVTRLDAELGRLLDGLRERGHFDRTIVVVTSDHGEAFGRHGIVEHSKDVYEGLVQVPFIVKGAGQSEGVVASERASSVDVPGLVARGLAEAGFDDLVDTFPRVPGNHPVLAENYYSRLRDLERYGERFRRQRYALFDGDWKLVAGSDGIVELYDVAVDAAESNDLASAEPAVVEDLLARLNELLDATRYEGERALPGQLTDVQSRDLDDLGYGGGR
ncbi:MAG: sulfatase [Planctomycetota bacterium]